MNKKISKKTTIIIITLIILAIILYIIFGVINLPDVIRAKNDTWLHEAGAEAEEESKEIQELKTDIDEQSKNVEELHKSRMEYENIYGNIY